MNHRVAGLTSLHGSTAAAAAGAIPVRRGLEVILGARAWQRLPPRVRTRFSEPALSVDYHGVFDVVRANHVGRVVAFLCRALGTPVTPVTGCHVPAVVRVRPGRSGVQWQRDYCWPDRGCSRISSTKVIGTDGVLVERLPAGLCMPLQVDERAGSLRFTSRGYYFELAVGAGARLRLPLPACLSPGVTNVEHTDEDDGWFRFTMTVTHPLLGELFFQTGRFRAAGGLHDPGL